MNLNRIDLNLFAVFDAIYTSGSLTKAAEVLCITQPAVSNSLSRLRDLLDDPLFVRTGHKMVPTPVAQNVIGPARQALQLLRHSVQSCHQFEPLQAERNYSFSMIDVLEAGVLPRLTALLQKKAPGITLTSYPTSIQEVVSEMSSGQLDFYLDGSTFTDPYLNKKKIANDRFVVVARKGHPELENGLTMETFLNAGHINITEKESKANRIDVALHKMGKKRKVVLQGLHYMTVPAAIVKTDLLACLPFHFAKHANLAIYEMPFEVPAIEYFLYWHVSANDDAAHSWMRQQITEEALGFSPRG